MSEENKAVAHRVWKELFNERNLAVADELFSPTYVNHAAPPGTPPGPEPMKQLVRMLTAAFPDHRVDIEDTIAEGDKVVSRLWESGTHLGAFMGSPPSGKSFRIQQIHIARVAGGKVVEHWAVRDELARANQIGLSIPMPPR